MLSPHKRIPFTVEAQRNPLSVVAVAVFPHLFSQYILVQPAKPHRYALVLRYKPRVNSAVL
ncbi:hypothetical protein HD806DRAFT_477299 [Xylariaceae sp. AK1471]|nr:hypothetical protein HD806DRAFT_477299 [Xylariaceae sp. AK1471]